MSKYIIEIPDDVQYVLLNGKADNKYYTAVRPIAELEELNSDYINENFGSLQDDVYKRGLSDVSASGYRRQYEDGYRRGYKNGRNIGIKDGMCDAWEAARKIIRMPDGDILDLFPDCYASVCTAVQAILKYDASDAIAKLKAYEDKRSDRIEVGDEVRTRDGAPSHTFLVTKVTDSHVYGISDDGSWNYWTKDEVTKTGKHYDIQSILEAMRK